VGCLLIAACDEAQPGQGKFMAATIDGTYWRATGQASQQAILDMHYFGIRGYTPMMPAADGSFTNAPAPGEPRLDIIFTNIPPEPGTYDIATTTNIAVTYGPDESRTSAAQTGTVEITRIAQYGVDGTFAFTGSLTPGGPDTVAVTQGSFSAPILIVP